MIKFFRKIRAIALITGLCLCIGCSGGQQPESLSPESDSLPMKPVYCPEANLILISIDTLRADHLSCYGYERKTSPNMDIFAGESILFEDHVTPMTTTLPAHLSMLTGLYPRSHGAKQNGVKVDSKLDTLAELLKEQGYTTAAITAAYSLHSDTNYSQGFDYLSEVPSEQVQVDAANVLSRALPWVRDNKDSKFFLFLHFFDPHGPYAPPPEFSIWEGSAPTKPDKVRAKYDGEIYYVDNAIGQFLGALKESGLYDKSLIVLTADHGESLEEHDFWGHGRCLHEPCLHVPLIMRFPGALEVQPRRVSTLTSAIDLFPTLLNCLQVEYRSEPEGLDLFGEAINTREFVFAERQYFGGQDNEVMDMSKMGPWETYEYGKKSVIRAPGWKYTWRSRFEDEFYNLEEDPEEKTNLLTTGEKSEEDLEVLRTLLRDWLEGKPLLFQVDDSIDQEAKEKLQKLGYFR